MATPEARSEQSPSGEPVGFRLTHVGNQRVVESLGLFKEFGMKGHRAAFYLLSLFEPLPVGEDDMGLIKSGETKPETLFDQVGWAYANPQILTEEQKGALPALLLFPLESLANNSQVHWVGGEERDLSDKARRTAQETLEAYGKYLAKTLDPDNPESVNVRKTIAAIGSAASLVAGTITLAAYAATIKSASAIKIETQTPIPTLVSTETVTPTPYPISPTETSTPTVEVTPTPTIPNIIVLIPPGITGPVNWNPETECASDSNNISSKVFGENPPSDEGPFFFDQIAHFRYIINTCTGEVKIEQLSQPGQKGYIRNIYQTEMGLEGEVAGYYSVIVHNPKDTNHWEDYKEYYAIMFNKHKTPRNNK